MHYTIYITEKFLVLLGYNTMKKARTALFCLLFVSFSLLLAACFSPWAGDDDKGTVVLNLGAAHGRSAAMSQIQYTIYLRRIVDDIPGNRVQHGQPVSHGSTISITVAPGTYHIELEAKLNGYEYAHGSTSAPVTVTAGVNASATVQMTMTFGNHISDFLVNSTAGVTPSDPILLPWVSQLSNSNWNDLLDALQTSGKYVSLDLSATLRGGSGELLDNNGVFDPRNSTPPNDPRKAFIVSLILPDAAETIPDGTGGTNFPFMDFTNLLYLDTGNGITSVGSIAFYDLNLETVFFGNKLQTLGLQSFLGNKLTSVVIPPSVTSIEGSAFDSNPLKEIELGSYLSVAVAAFDSHSSVLETITIGTDVVLHENAIPHFFKTAYDAGGAGVYIRIYDDFTLTFTWVKQ